jgi:ABC-type transport system substrate-binding protein
LKEAEKLLSDEMPLTSLYHWKNTYLQKPNVKDLQIYPTGSFHLQEIYFENDELKD